LVVIVAMSKRWYVLRSKPKKERSLCKLARSQGHVVFFPTIPVNPVNPRAARIRPYFPGYMFVLADMAEVGPSTFHWMPFSQGLVSVGVDPVPVPENIINALHRRVGEIWDAGGLVFDGLQKGEQVFIREGVFEGYRAIFDVRLPGSERVRVLLEMLNRRYVPVEVNVGLLERIEGN
jgi:transcription antitermination factor NusG